MFEVGDIVRGTKESDKYYDITNSRMTKGVVQGVCGGNVIVRVLKHMDKEDGSFVVRAECFEKIGHADPFDRKKFMELMAESKEKALEYLTEANLSGANLSGADLSRAYLSRADLTEADLSRADLTEADLSRADLTEANLSRAYLTEAYLSRADLSRADLTEANLTEANLSGANLSGADLSRANLSGAKGLTDAIDYLETNFERTEEGYIVYKTFGAYNTPPETWEIKEGSVIEEVCNPDRTNKCGCGINVATLDWVKKDNDNSDRKTYKLLIKLEWLPGVVVPYGTDGKIRCSRAQIIGEA